MQFRLCYFRRIVDFFLLIAPTHKATTNIPTATEASAALLNSGTVGVVEADVVEVAEGDEVGLAEADELAESDKTESTLL